MGWMNGVKLDLQAGFDPWILQPYAKSSMRCLLRLVWDLHCTQRPPQLLYAAQGPDQLEQVQCAVHVLDQPG